MKKFILAIAIAAALPTFVAKAQTRINKPQQAQATQMLQGPGPVIAGSFDYKNVPDKAKKFIETNFKGVNVMKVEKEFGPDKYDITLANGVELEFNAKGDLDEIEGLNAPLPYSVVKAILPAAAAKTLETKAAHNAVKSIDVEKSYFEVEFVKQLNLNLKEMKFDNAGKTLKVEKY